jgi:hypothetical protein
MVIPSFCAIKLYYLCNYHGAAVNYHGKKFYSLAHGGKLKYRSNLLQNFNPRDDRVKITVVNYHGIVITLASGVNVIKRYRSKLPR